MRKFNYAIIGAAILSMTACSENNGPKEPELGTTDPGLFVVCNGQFGADGSYGSLTFYDTKTEEAESQVFNRANGVPLGKTAQSMAIHGKTGWICVNGSDVVFAIDVNTYKEKGRVVGISGSRYIEFVSDNKAYVSALNSNVITIIDPQKRKITGTITVPGMDATTGSTEQLIKVGNYVYCNCWSFQKELIKIDTTTDEVVASLVVGEQPKCIAYDGNGTLWVMTDGGWDSTWTNKLENPALHAIDLATFSETRKIELSLYANISDLCYHDGYLYWLDGGVRKMNVNDSVAPEDAFIPATGWGWYALTVDPDNGDIYVGDAIDYQQNGVVYHYDAAGTLLSNFSCGVAPDTFCWKK